MAVPTLKLDLAPPTNLWRMNHGPLGLAALAAGGVLLAASLGFTWHAYAQAATAGQRTVTLAAQTSRSSDQQRQVLAELREVDVAKELPRWRLAEKIFTERSLPWSRLTAELERSLVVDVRLKSIQRTRSSDMKVQLKVKGEARTREAEARFVESLQKNAFFEAVLLEREGERQGGGVDFDYTLAAESVPQPFVPLPKQPKYGPAKPLTPAKSAVVPMKTPAIPMARPANPKPVPTPAPAAGAAPAQVDPYLSPSGEERRPWRPRGNRPGARPAPQEGQRP
jgi:hypothetical protein